jgi:cadmium resistance protein CadD (predicted permease)
VLGAAAAAFGATNVDAFVVLTLLFAASRSTGTPRPGQIVAGQALGFATWVGASILGAAGLRLVATKWLGLAGLLPLAVGLYGLFHARAPDRHEIRATGTLSVAGLTIANGVDNVTVYVLLFAHQRPRDELLTITTFSSLLVGLCGAAALVGGHKKAAELIGGIARWLIPAVFLAIGAWIMIKSDALTNLLATR